ncbi:MAG: Inner rane transporter permease protein YnjC [Pseudomonadota bacterium]
MSWAWPGLLALLAGLPLALALQAAVSQMLDASAWQAFWSDPQTTRAWGLTLWTGLASTLLTWYTVAHLLARGFIRQTLMRWVDRLPAWLATPHVALAIGLVLCLSPSGWALRMVSPGLTGFESPPPWATTQDPWGLGLIVALWLKEVPFLLWVAATQLQREDVRRRWQAEFALAQTLGHSPQQAFAQGVWPQWAPLLRWPLLAVLAYGLTVVDMALIVGPAAPPTLAVLTWQWLADADVAMQAQGAAASGALTLTVLGLGMCGLAAFRAMAVFQTTRLGLNDKVSKEGILAGGLGWIFNPAYGAIWLALALGSVIGVWPFPQLWPSAWTFDAWSQVWASGSTVWRTLVLALVSASVGVCWSMAWLEWAPLRWQRALRPWWLLPLVLPAILWVVGLYSVALQWRLEGRWLGLLIAHGVMVLPYTLLALEPAYGAVDPRQSAVVACLGQGRWRYLLSVKWPLLRRAIASAWAVAFAVSVAQYLPTLFVGAGRFATVTTEAVTLASGGQRSLMSAYAVLQMVLPLLAFALASAFGRPRSFEKISA